MDDKNRFLSSGEFVWGNLSGETGLCVVSYFLMDQVVVYECLTGKEYIVDQPYVKRVASKDYVSFCNIPSFAKFRKYAVQADAFLERFAVDQRYAYICKGIFDDHTIDPPSVVMETKHDMETPAAGDIEKPSIELGSIDKATKKLWTESPPQGILENPEIGNYWNPAIALLGVFGVFVVIAALD